MISFDNSPTVYWFAGYILAGIVIVAGIFRLVPERVFMGLSILLLIFMRLPVIVFNKELNPDESQMLSHAITLFRDPLYWRSVDGTTIGPLDNYLLVVPRILGFQLSYISARLIGILCTCGSLLFLFFTLKNWFGNVTARTAFVLPLVFLSFTQEKDFVHYSSEQLPILLLSLSVWLLSRITTHSGSLKSNALFLGLTAGTIPFAKLQAVPQALVIVFCASWVCYRWFRLREDPRPLQMLLLGGLTFPVITFTWAYFYQVLTDLIDFYLFGNVIYANGNEKISILSQLLLTINQSADFISFTIILMIPFIVAVIRIFKRLPDRKEEYIIRFTILLLIVTTIYAVTKSGNNFIHYLNFCLIPWTLLAAYGLENFKQWCIVPSVLLLIWFAAKDAYFYVKEHRLNDYASHDKTDFEESAVVKALRKYSKPDDYMVVWGWQSGYYVEAQLPQGTAESHSERSIFNHPMRQKYFNRYVKDIKRTKPAIILDAVGKNSLWLQDKKTQSIESFPGIYTYIQKNYSLVGSFDDTKLYVRKDRL
ncbi:hypothetical protein [Dyadobacter sediminis]|uniref:Glycosyltransferase RgtA/B/C/D-like domain-containing protein n=1 Tax=Dyadobacter sediminis TaxID=1493691 RepID=A0A5R9K801_9BACT|nr:hypothetical protein [Dyadobacter sediminis]TLU89974.1 hypothetical protein FEM55_20855 [Dyadobacter sediminis]GGC11200.1 hypothetical protein GCM10011325_42560 [Dyadobacter sediminis]